MNNSESRSYGPAGGTYPTQIEEFLFAAEVDLVIPDASFESLPSIQLENRGTKSHDETPKNEQTEFWKSATVHKESLVSKLLEAGLASEAEVLGNCGRWQSVAECRGCGTAKRFSNRCDRMYCPTCAPKLAADRRRSVEWWAAQIKQPKHVVLTTRNTRQLSAADVAEFKASLTRLRRSAFARHWRGGMWSLEITNEGRGWHLHAHLLVDADWIDAPKLAIQWEKSTRGAGCIVKVLDCRERGYLQEVTKYTVKGSEIAAWSPYEVRAFVLAFAETRTFGVFGSLFGIRAQFTAEIADLVLARNTCQCGCARWKIMDARLWEAQSEPVSEPPPPDLPAPSFAPFPFDAPSHPPPVNALIAG